MSSIVVKMAGVPFRVDCEHRENIRFLSAYATDEAPQFAIVPTKEDKENMRLELARAGEPSLDDFVENNAIHALIAERLAGEHVLLLHGSALCMDGDACVFIAPSGTGKSTHARLWREAFGDRVWMINDDKPFIRISGDGCQVYGSPWDGKHHLSRNASAPLKAVVHLTRGRENRIVSAERADAFQILMRHSFLPDHDTKCIVSMLDQLTNRIPCYHLSCNRNPSAALAAYTAIFRQELV